MRFKEFLNEDLLLELSIGKAAVFADKYHSGQHRKTTGAPYIIHPLATYRILRSVGVKDRELLVAAWLHDVIEDTPATYNDLKKEFNSGVADLVRGVTSDPKALFKVGKDEYLTNKMIGMSDRALSLKLADRVQNLSDIMTANPKFAQKMFMSTTYIITALEQERSLNKIHKKLIKIIKKSLGQYEKKNVG